MATQLSSETLPQNRIATKTNTSPNLIVTINNTDYKIEVVLHKKGQSKEDGYLINPAFLNTITFKDSLFDLFPLLTINYEDKESNSMPYQFSQDLDDMAYVYISKVQKEGENPPYPLVDDEFLIYDKTDGKMENANDNSKFFTVQLTLIPYPWADLTTLYPQWTTGFDTDYKKKSGKEVGKCIKEILEIGKQQIDDPIFDYGKTIINYTSTNENALDTIKSIFPYFLPSDDAVPGIFKYNPVTHKFVLKSIKSFFDHKDNDDDIKTYLTIPLKQYSTDKQVSFMSMLGTTLSRILNNETSSPASDYSHDINHVIQSLDSSPIKTLRVSRTKGTFVIDPQEFNNKEIETQIKKMFRDKDVNFGQSPSELVKKDEIIKKNFVFTPHYKKTERTALNKQATLKLLTASNFGVSIPTFGGEIQTGRKFAVKIAHGAHTEELRKKVGTYMIVSTVQFMDVRNNIVDSQILGVNILKSITGTYHL